VGERFRVMRCFTAIVTSAASGCGCICGSGFAGGGRCGVVRRRAVVAFELKPATVETRSGKVRSFPTVVHVEA
jgi:uncharacterized Fe-S cluster-containing radical SAM superfamily protein